MICTPDNTAFARQPSRLGLNQTADDAGLGFWPASSACKRGNFPISVYDRKFSAAARPTPSFDFEFSPPHTQSHRKSITQTVCPSHEVDGADPPTAHLTHNAPKTHTHTR